VRGEEFRLPGEPVDPRAGQPLGKPLGQGKTKVRAALFKPQDAPSLHDRGKSAANCLDFR
jgi:hypothetical protein